MRTDDFAFTPELDAIRTRRRRAIDGATVATLAASAADVPTLLSEVERLGALVLDTRLEYANLQAAVRAALSAAHDGEPDPFAYLADELYGEWPTPRHGRSRR